MLQPHLIPSKEVLACAYNRTAISKWTSHRASCVHPFRSPQLQLHCLHQRFRKRPTYRNVVVMATPGDSSKDSPEAQAQVVYKARLITTHHKENRAHDSSSRRTTGGPPAVFCTTMLRMNKRVRHATSKYTGWYRWWWSLQWVVSSAKEPKTRYAQRRLNLTRLKQVTSWNC